MKKFNIFFLSQIYLIITLALLLSFLRIIETNFPKPSIKLSKEQSSINFKPELVDLFSLGYKRFLTALIWVSTILESDHEHFKGKDTNSWMYYRFNLIKTLDPKFYENYAFGGTYLSIIKDDDLGAKDLYTQGLINFPNDYYLTSSTAFHYYFELKDIPNAIYLFNKLMFFPQTPKHLTSLYARILSGQGDLEISFNIIRELYEKNKDIPLFEKRYRENLYAIRAEIDLNCLNSNGAKCSALDFYGEPYIFNGSKYIAKTIWIPFRTKK